ncbi:MAG: UDP-N-acetylmuramoyl-L-alanyl-D-glutamate--2,6-diaminopimelate ligase [Pseudobdellovibrionaceae bacterium]|nr:UDP-N-acetylmuramoyl-L-alanyl-D-glutamate--2,6-diaminopimelate ligase [Bdellovibrionales bacterium]USN46396.1 MAG: UDP-N-acetylmuramoyl-L-alanyl-D-glutamate--2,6-diaminopimelate ligase [Pseudobdellovibrionaceae bacterium]
MKLSQLLSVYSQLSWGEFATSEVSQVCVDSRQVKPGCVFVAIKGYSSDGHDFLPQVCHQGAIAVVVEDRSQVPLDYAGAVVVVNDTRVELDRLASRFYEDPAKNFFCVGVTGTNGKTSTAYMVEKILTDFGWPTGVMGTIDHHLGKHRWSSQLTTPDPLTLQKRLCEFNALGAKAAVFEVSSHALHQYRADHIPFDVMVFTNLTRDHLDYHSDMDHYFKAKQRLFREIPLTQTQKSSVAVINTDDPYGRQMEIAPHVKRTTYGKAEADLKFNQIEAGFGGTRFHLSTPRGEAKVFLPIPGEHNVYNAVAAIGVGLAAGVSLKACTESLSQFSGVPGRLEKVPESKKVHVFVDYAHTDQALNAVLSTLQAVRQASSQAGSRIFVVYGCGGGRDKGKRPLMAKVAAEGADVAILTSDNPRHEDPRTIIEDGLVAVPKDLMGQSFFVEEDRRKAIAMALNMANNGDVVLVAGKGHEDYQIIGDEKRPFSDVQVVREILA